MAKYNVHAGHCPDGYGANGAVGLIKESTEVRKVKDKLISLLKNGNTVYDCTCDDNVSSGECLRRIVAKCNAHTVDLDISLHLNAGRGDYKGDGSTGGVEVLVYSSSSSSKSYATKICSQIASDFGYRNRGVKYRQDLYVLNKTKAPAVLIECCFVDDKDDVDKWNTDKCAESIYKALGGTVSSTSATSASNSVKGQPTTEAINDNGLYYRTHVQNYGDLTPVHDGMISGTTGQNLRIEALKIDTRKLGDIITNVELHIQNIGWKKYDNITSDTIIGTTGESKRIEAIRIEMLGLEAGKKFKYRVHLSGEGWTTWVENGYATGSVGLSKAIEAVQLVIE